MKHCPHCDAPLSADQSRCPSCGAPYWDPNLPADPDSEIHGPDAEAGGCLSLVALPIGVSLGVFSGLILFGFLLEKLLNWDSMAVRFIWISLSAGVGLKLFDRLKPATPEEEEIPPDRRIDP